MTNYREIFSKKQFLYVIAEVGTEHWGEIDRAILLVELAKKSGANAVKFQHVYPWEIYPPCGARIEVEKREINIGEHFKKVQMTEGFLQKIGKHTQEIGIDLIVTAYGEESLAEVEKHPIAMHKIASPELTHPYLLEGHQKHKKFLLLSTGVSRWKDILYAKRHFAAERICFLQCVTSYPADPFEYNLLCMVKMGQEGSGILGVSDHTRDPYEIPGLAYGISILHGRGLVLEKHITVGDRREGIDRAVSLTPEEFTKMIIFIEKMKKDLLLEIQTGERFFEEEEVKFDRKKIKAAVKILSKVTQMSVERVDKIVGNGRKELTKGEEKLYYTTNRSLFATRDIEKDGLISKENTGYFRSEQPGTKGLGYEFHEEIGKWKVKSQVRKGDQLTEDKVGRC